MNKMAVMLKTVTILLKVADSLTPALRVSHQCALSRLCHVPNTNSSVHKKMMSTESGDREKRPFDHSQGKSYSYNHTGMGTPTVLKNPTKYSAHERATAACS